MNVQIMFRQATHLTQKQQCLNSKQISTEEFRNYYGEEHGKDLYKGSITTNNSRSSPKNKDTVLI
jgi:hypothetical protein